MRLMPAKPKLIFYFFAGFVFGFCFFFFGFFAAQTKQVMATDYLFGVDNAGTNFIIQTRVGAGTPTPTPLMVLTTAGNLGLGTSAPAYPLDIVGTSQITNTAGNISIIPASNLVITQGSVGIGTTSPGYKLDVNGTGNFVTSLTVAGATGGVVPSGAVMFFNLTACPSGWTALTAAAGRVIVGRAIGTESIGSTVGTALSSLEDRTHTHTGPSHTHAQNIGTYCADCYQTNGGSAWTGVASGVGGSFTSGGGGAPGGGYPVQTGVQAGGTGATGTAATSNVIPYIQYLVCSKN